MVRPHVGAPRSVVVALASGAAVLAVLLGALVWLGPPGGDRDAAATGIRADRQRYGAAPTYTMTDQRGDRVSSRRFAGRVQVVGFLFPYCTTDCPVLAHDLAELQHRLTAEGLGDETTIVTFNVDPTGARPHQLAAFLGQYGAHTDPATAGTPWYYLTGSAQQTRHVVRDGYRVAYWKEAGEEEGVKHPNALAKRVHPGYDVKHQDVVYIVDGQGRIREYVGSPSEMTADSLLRAVRRVLDRP